MPDSDPVDNSEKSLGVYLRETREARGLHLDDAARVTRIGKNYLVALEDGMFDKLPNPAYVKGFLRIYAGYLGVSGDTVVAMFERDTAPPQTRSVVEKEPARRNTHPASGKGRWLIPTMLLVMILLVAYIFDDKEPRRSPAPQLPVAPPIASVPAPVQGVRTSATTAAIQPPPLPVPATIDAVSPPSEQPAKGIVLRLKINQDSWLNITIDGAVSQQYDLKAGDLIEWKGERLFTLDLGNAGGIEGEFNGKPLKPFGEEGKAAHIELKGDGA